MTPTPTTTLTLLGLGPGHSDDLTRRAWKTLESAAHVYLRTERHPCVPDLPTGPTYHPCDDLYETHKAFSAVYDAITARVLGAARNSDVVYAVPGDPFMGEATTARLLQGAEAAGIHVEIVHGLSFVEPSLKLVGVDGMGGLQILDGLDIAALHHPSINPDAPALIGQVYSRQVASDIKLTLMNQYADDFAVTLIHAAGTPDAIMETLPLHELDRSDNISHLTSLYIPAAGNMASFEQFQEIIAHLRAPEGCPWDREQTHESLRPYLIEEAYEVLEAIDNGDWNALYEELGDLLLQVVLHTQVAIDDGEFYMTDVLRHVSNKMIRRHPHVWGDTVANDAGTVLKNWEMLKKAEYAANGRGGQRDSLLDGVPKGLPALAQSLKYQEKAAKVGFDWPEVSGVLDKVREEMAEIEAAPTPEARFEEFGDLMFVLVNFARWMGIADPESALREANAKFYRRFRYVENAVAESGKPFSDYTLAELDVFWDAAKATGL